MTRPQPTSSFRPFFQSFGLFCSSSSYTSLSNTLYYRVSGTALRVPNLRAVAPALVRGAQDPPADPTGLVAGTTAVALHHLPRHTQRMDLPRPGLKDKEVVPVFGQAWPQEVWVRICTTGSGNPVHKSDPNRRLGIGNGLGWRGHLDGSVSLNPNPRFPPDGDRLRGTTIIEARVPRTLVR